MIKISLEDIKKINHANSQNQSNTAAKTSF